MCRDLQNPLRLSHAHKQTSLPWSRHSAFRDFFRIATVSFSSTSSFSRFFRSFSSSLFLAWRRVPRRTPCGFAVPRGSSASCVPCGTRLPTGRPYWALFRVPWLFGLRTFAESPTPRSCPTTSKLVSVAILGLLTFRLSGPV